MRTNLAGILILLVLVSPLFGAQAEGTEVNWPSDGPPIVHFEFAKFKYSKSGEQTFYVGEVTVVNLWSNILDASFDVFVFDKSKTRVGQGYIRLSHVRPGEKVKLEMTISTTGEMATFQLVAKDLPETLRPPQDVRTVKVSIYSIPPGASLLVDGKPAGTTPIDIKIAPGKHDVSLTHEGYRAGHYEYEVSEDQLNGGSITYELGGLAADTVEMRDGTVLTGDVLSMDGKSVSVRAGGVTQRYARNMVKKIILVEREPAPLAVGTSK
ncbi:MAG: PEGA domain-containing protein [Acidobacteria bacterium]|nr:PEGA domain-containing protein [Acidobacteriota bacterium]